MNHWAIKKKFLDSRVSSLKSLVIRYMQFQRFKSKVIGLHIANEVAVGAEHKISTVEKLYAYLYNTRDIWCSNEVLVLAWKNKAVYFSLSRPDIFDKWLIAFGYKCPYMKRNQQLCCQPVDQQLCCRHQHCDQRRKAAITAHLSQFPIVLCNIIDSYAKSYDWRVFRTLKKQS
jgi:hypothetical protein